MDQKQQIERLIHFLEDLKERPSIHITGAAPSVENFISGFNSACYLFGFNIGMGSPDLEEAMLACGWEDTPQKSLYQMTVKGLSDDEITQEVLKYHTLAWKMYLERLENPE